MSECATQNKNKHVRKLKLKVLFAAKLQHAIYLINKDQHKC